MEQQSLGGRTFQGSLRWGFIPGPGFVESIGGALAAADLWLRQTPDDARIRQERQMMTDLREMLAAVPPAPSEDKVRAVALEIRTFVAFARNRAVVPFAGTKIRSLDRDWKKKRR